MRKHKGARRRHDEPETVYFFIGMNKTGHKGERDGAENGKEAPKNQLYRRHARHPITKRRKGIRVGANASVERASSEFRELPRLYSRLFRLTHALDLRRIIFMRTTRLWLTYVAPQYSQTPDLGTGMRRGDW